MSIHFDKSRMEEVLENHERWWRGELERPFGEGKPGPIYWMDVYRKILDAGKLIQIDGNPFKEGGYLDVLAEVHGCPFTFFYAKEKDRDAAIKVINAR